MYVVYTGSKAGRSTRTGYSLVTVDGIPTWLQDIIVPGLENGTNAEVSSLYKNNSCGKLLITTSDE